MRKSTIYGLMSAREQREHGWRFLRNNDGGDDSGAAGGGPDDSDDQGDDDGGTGDDDQDGKGSDDGKPQNDGKANGGDKPPVGDKPKGGKSYDEKYVRGLRQENASSRAQFNQLRDAILGVLDPEAKAAGAKLDPAQLTEQLTKTQVENRTLKIERALDRAARHHKADEDLLVAWLAHKGRLNDLDPTSDDFAAQLDEMVAEAVKKNPKLKADTTPVPTRSGGDFAGGGEKRSDSAPESIDDHRAQRRKRREVGLKP